MSKGGFFYEFARVRGVEGPWDLFVEEVLCPGAAAVQACAHGFEIAFDDEGAVLYIVLHIVITFFLEDIWRIICLMVIIDIILIN